MPSNYIRSIRDVDLIAEKAKLQISDLLPKAQALYFAKDCHTTASQMTLVEADPHVLEHVERGGSLVIRGEPADGAVVCTGDRTYEVREAETSNSLVLLDALSWPDQLVAETPRLVTSREAMGTFFTYLELRECRPRVRRLQRLLQAEPYCGRLQPGTGYSLVQLVDTVQASSAQLSQALAHCHAVQLDGLYRVLECEYEFHVFSLIMKFIDENSWRADRVRRDVTVATLAELETRPVVDFCFGRFFQPSGETLDGEELYTFREDEVAVLFAELLLRPMKTFHLADFLTSWAQSVPEGVHTSLDRLRGVAVVNREVKPEVVVRLRPLDLPEETPARFQALFDLKKLWTVDEILPYVEDLTSPSVKIGSLLAKHTRMSAKSGVKMYGPKHGH